MTCKEFVLDDALSITAIPVDDFVLGTAGWQLKPAIPVKSFAPVLKNTITIGLWPATTGGKLVPIVRQTGKAKDVEGDSVAGRLHTVTVTCEVDDRDLTADGDGNTILDYLLTLERTPSHLLITFRDQQTQAFVSATEDSYVFKVDRDGAKTSVQFRIENYMGVQRLV